MNRAATCSVKGGFIAMLSLRIFLCGVLATAPLLRADDSAIHTISVGAPPYAIDIIFAISGVSFEEAWANSIEGVTTEGIPVRYLSAEHFMRNKTAAGRLQDLADVAAVRASKLANGDS